MSKKIVTINGYDVRNALGYVYDGCHQFYIIEDEAERKSCGATVKPLTDDMFRRFLASCPFRFIYNWKRNRKIVPQVFEMEEDSPVEFEFEDGTIGIYDPNAKYEE